MCSGEGYITDKYIVHLRDKCLFDYSITGNVMYPTFIASYLWVSQAVKGKIIKAFMRKVAGVWGNYARV